VYCNNSVVKTVDLTSVTPPNSDTLESLVIGYYDTEYFSGSIDDLRFYKGKAITAGEVATIYALGLGKKYEAGDVAGASAVVAFDFDEGVGTTTDSKGTVLTGTFTGGVTWSDGGVPFVFTGGGFPGNLFEDIFDYNE